METSELHAPWQHPAELQQLCRRVADLEPRSILEIGTARGGTLREWLRLVQPGGTVVSVDLPVFGEDHRELFQTWAPAEVMLHCLHADSHAPETAARIAALLPEVDFLFIDGDHTYAGAKQDWETYGPLVRPGGLVAFHDIRPNPHRPHIQVHRLWQELQGSGYHTEELCAGDGTPEFGIGLLRVPSHAPRWVVGIAAAPGAARQGLRTLRGLRRLLPAADFRYPPETARALVQAALGERPMCQSVSSDWLGDVELLIVTRYEPELTGCVRAALASGIPILACEHPDLQRLLGQAGCFVAPRSGPAGLAAAAARLRSDPSTVEELTRRGRALAYRLRRREQAATEAAVIRPVSVSVDASRPLPAVAGVATGQNGSGTNCSLQVAKPSRPTYRRVSVVLALHGGRSLTADCLRTVRAELGGLPLEMEGEIVCVDNASPDDTRHWLEGQRDLQVVPLPENRGCPGGWNAGLARASGDLLCVLNNDTLIHPGGLRALFRAAWETGIAACAGGVLDAELRFVGMTANAAEADYPDGCALAFRRDVWEAAGPFDEGMGLGYCEDSDWGLRARSLGYRWAIVPDILTHLGSQTAAKLPEMDALQARNQQRLRERWQGKGVGERLLVRRWGALGDVLMALPSLRGLRRTKPLARLHLQCAPHIAQLLEGLPELDSVGVGVLAAPTSVVDLDDAYEAYERHGEWRHPAYAFAERLGVPISPEAYAVPVPEELAAWAAELLPGNAGDYVAVGLRSACRPLANWGEAAWRELAQALPGHHLVLLDAEWHPDLEVRSRYSGPSLYAMPNVLDLTGRTPSLRHVLALLYRCGASVSVDTGLFHLANAAGIPTLGLMGGTPGFARAPLGGKFLVLDGVAPCFPCGGRSDCDRLDGPHCLAAISPERVAAQLRGWTTPVAGKGPGGRC